MAEPDIATKGIKFVLRGGKHDGLTVRLYPDNTRDMRQKGAVPLFADLEFGGVLYEHPAGPDQSDKKPFLIARRP